MATIPKPVVMEFEQDTEKRFKEVRHYNLIKGKDLLSQKLNLSNNRGYSKAKYKYSLKTWKNKKWSSQLTGLFPTYDTCLFFGDTRAKTNLLLVKFTNNEQKLRLYYFPNYYPSRIDEFIRLFKSNA